MPVITIDFETYYSSDYSLSKMSEVEYVLDPRFQVIMVAIKQHDQPTQVFTDPLAIRTALAEIDWENSACLSHNARFDGSILAWHFGYTPRLYLDTLSMARALTHAEAGSSSLKKVSEHLGLPPKGDEVVRAMGKRREDFTADELQAYAEYCVNDTDLCYQIFDMFMGERFRFPKQELLVIDLALRMFIDPMAQLDAHKLAAHLNYVKAERERLFVGQDKSVFASNAKFAALLEAHGVRVPRKISPATNQITWALSRNDVEFKRLCDDPTQPLAVQVMLMQRRGAKSTIEETRTQTMLNLSLREWPGRESGWMPVPYTYYGAHTGRFSGTQGFNFANLPRRSPIRDSIRAPKGWRVMHRDASQIECRVEAHLARCETLLAGFRAGRDVYCDFGHGLYGREITKAHARERFSCKTAVLSLGYGASWQRFKQALFIGQGGMSVELTDGEAERIVSFYRETAYREIPALWRYAKDMLEVMLQGGSLVTLWPGVVVHRDRITLPNGLALRYPDLQLGHDPDYPFTLTYRGPKGERKKLYGAKLIENITQALARIHVTDVMCRVFRETGFRPFMGTYDSWDYMMPDSVVGGMDVVLEREFKRPPAWAPYLPLASEGGWGRTLMEAEKGVNQ